MDNRSRTFAVLHIAVLLAGATGLFGRYISMGGLPLVWYRIMVAVITMTIAMFALKRLRRIAFRNVLPILVCGFLLAFHWVAFFASIKASNVSVGVVCIATSCFFTLCFQPFLAGKKVRFADILVSFITILGVMLIFSLDIRYRTGILLGLLSAAIYSVFAILNIRVAEKTSQDSATMLFYELIGGLAILTVVTPVYFALNPGVQMAPTSGDMLGLILLGSIFTVVPFLFQIHALRELSAFTVNVTYNLEPVYSIIFAAILFGETRELNWSFWVGLTLVVLSVVLQTVRASKSKTI